MARDGNKPYRLRPSVSGDNVLPLRRTGRATKRLSTGRGSNARNKAAAGTCWHGLYLGAGSLCVARRQLAVGIRRVASRSHPPDAPDAGRSASAPVALGCALGAGLLESGRQ